MPSLVQFFLRSPRFPWVRENVAAVSQAGNSTIADPDALLAAIGAARVGGEFWSPTADPWRGDITADAVRPGDDAAIVGLVRGTPVRDAEGNEIPRDALRLAAIDRLAAASYRDPFTDQRIDAIDAVTILAAWRRTMKCNRPITATTGMAAWKREAIAQFLWDGTASPPALAADAALDRGGAVAYWPSRVPADYSARAAALGIPAWAVEDGFLRSAGLGAECRPPMSILIDRTGGIYFDPDRASELETILATAEFDGALLARARRLREAVVAAGLGKYGVDLASPMLPALPAGRRIVLAIGQVDDDLSVLRGGAGIEGNAAFLARVRDEEPGAYVLYRPHPDVLAGLRRGRVADPVAAGLADGVVAGGGLPALVARADVVHVLSSLSGFEALLRKRPVVVHGMPFYAGWGLTRDLVAAPARRGRQLPLDALVAGALILAPRYRDPVTGLPCEAETLVARLVAAPVPGDTFVTRFRKALGATRRTLAAAGERL